jgi:hypothetical protein
MFYANIQQVPLPFCFDRTIAIMMAGRGYLQLKERYGQRTVRAGEVHEEIPSGTGLCQKQDLLYENSSP